MTRRRFSVSTILAVFGVLGLFTAAWCADSRNIEAGTGSVSEAARSQQLLARGLDAPGSLVLGTRGNHYVAVYGAILMLGPDGSVTTIADDLPAPLVLSVAPDGDLYAAAPSEGRVYRIAQDGCCTVAAEGLPEPAGIAVDRDGNFTVSLAGTGEVVTLLRSK